MTDYQHAVDIIGEALLKAFPCKHCDVLSCVYVHGGCCRDMFLGKVPNDVDLDLDTQKLQGLASECQDNKCALKKFYDANKDEYVKIGAMPDFEERLSAWMISDKVINTRYLLKSINEDERVSGTRDNSKRKYVITFLIFCKNGIDIDIMDTIFYFDNRYVSTIGRELLFQTVGNQSVMPYFMDFVVAVSAFSTNKLGAWSREEVVKKAKKTQEQYLKNVKNWDKSEVKHKLYSIFTSWIKEAAAFLFKYAGDATALFLMTKQKFNQQHFPGLMEKEDLSEQLPFKKVKRALMKVLGFYPLIPTPWYPISHLCHSYQADCTFNGLYLRVKDIYRCGEGLQGDVNEQIVQHWKKSIQDPYTHAVFDGDDDGDDEKHGKEGGIYDVKHGIVRTYEHEWGANGLYIDFTELVLQSQPEMMIYRTVKNVSKLLGDDGKVRSELEVEEITLGEQLCDNFNSFQLEYNADTMNSFVSHLFKSTLDPQWDTFEVDEYGVEQGAKFYSDGERDRIVRHVFTTYGNIDMEIRAAVFHLLGFGKLLVKPAEKLEINELFADDEVIKQSVNAFKKSLDEYANKQTNEKYAGLMKRLEDLVGDEDAEDQVGVIKTAFA